MYYKGVTTTPRVIVVGVSRVIAIVSPQNSFDRTSLPRNVDEAVTTLGSITISGCRSS